jgi:lysozyme family protein
MAKFEPAVEIVLEHEGGYVNDPRDAGGETKYGITKRYYPSLDIKNLTKAKAKEIYKRDYWDANRLGEINSQRIANFALDTVVQHGYGPKLLQQIVNALRAQKILVDGKIGTETLKAINGLPSEGLFILKGLELRKAYIEKVIKNEPQLEAFRAGFMKRLSSFGSFDDGIVASLVPLALLSYAVVKVFKFS